MARAPAVLLGRSALLRVGPPRRARDRPSSDGAQDAPRLARRERAADETRPPLAPPCAVLPRVLGLSDHGVHVRRASPPDAARASRPHGGGHRQIGRAHGLTPVTLLYR